MRGQASVEFLMLISLLTLIFAISVNYFLGYGVNTSTYLSEANYQSICRQVSEEINYALSYGPDYERSFYLPQGSYEVLAEGYEISVRHSQGVVNCYSNANATGNLSIGKNTIVYNGTGLYFK